MLKAAYPAIKAADPAATVLVGGLVGNDFEFLEKLYDNGAKGSFDGVGVHTDTACLTTDPREYYREPSGRIGRYSFTGYREVRATMLAHGDDKPVWMTELGWASTTAVCERGGRAGTKAGGVTQAEQADFLAKAYGCLANDPWVEQAAWFNLHDLQTGSTNDSLNLGLVTDALRAQARLRGLPARGVGAPDPVRRHDGQRRAAGHHPLADRRPALPDLAADLGDRPRRPGRQRHRPRWSTARRSRSRRSRAAPAPRSSSSGAAPRSSPTARTRSSRPRATRPRTSAARPPRSSTSAAARSPTRSRRRSTSRSARSRPARSR